MFPFSRRDFLARAGMGFGLTALGPLLADDARGAVDATNPLAPRAPHFPAKAKRVIHIFANGGPSQVDTWDYKPELERRHGQPLPTSTPPPGSSPARSGRS